MTNVPQDPLSAALLPVVIHDLNNATQLLTTLNTLLGMPGGERFLTERAGDLASVGEEVFELGWLMAALASSAGDDLLLARRHETGLDVMVDYVRKSLRRQQHDLAQAEAALPRISNTHGAGWEAAWALGVFLWTAGLAADEAAAWTWTREDSHFKFETDLSLPAPDSLQILLQSRTRDISIEVTSECSRLCIPALFLEA